MVLKFLKLKKKKMSLTSVITKVLTNVLPVCRRRKLWNVEKCHKGHEGQKMTMSAYLILHYHPKVIKDTFNC